MKSKKLMYALFGMSALAVSYIDNASAFVLCDSGDVDCFPITPPCIFGDVGCEPITPPCTVGNVDCTPFPGGPGLDTTGTTASNPFIGTPIPGGSGWSFMTINSSGLLFFDPAVAVGYFFSSSVAFSGVTIGFAYGDDLYDLSVWNGSGALNDVASYTSLLSNWNGDLYNFASNNITNILISGIETSAAIDPANPTGFVTGFTFAPPPQGNLQPVNLIQIPVTADVPEPQIGLLLGLGLLVMRTIRFGSNKA